MYITPCAKHFHPSNYLPNLKRKFTFGNYWIVPNGALSYYNHQILCQLITWLPLKFLIISKDYIFKSFK